jgi:hypothetical protein
MIMKQTFGKTEASCCHVITNTSIKAEERNEMKLTFKQPHFLLCSSCFWCASYLNFCGTVEVCPSCMNGEVESMPISDKEIYTFRYDAIRGVTLEFRTKLN